MQERARDGGGGEGESGCRREGGREGVKVRAGEREGGVKVRVGAGEREGVEGEIGCRREGEGEGESGCRREGGGEGESGCRKEWGRGEAGEGESVSRVR